MAARKKPAVAAQHPLMNGGRDWDREKVMDYICESIASSNKGLVTILSNGFNGLNLPDYVTIDRWLREDEALCQRYAIAKDSQADYLAEEMIELADTCTDPQKARLQIDTRKWIAAKLKPKKYSDKLDLNHSGAVEFTGLKLEVVDPCLK